MVAALRVPQPHKIYRVKAITHSHNMADAAVASGPSQLPKPTVQQIYADIAYRRAALKRALCEDHEELIARCKISDDDNKSLCLYSDPREGWGLTVLPQDVPPDFPEPSSGINFAVKHMPQDLWLLTVARHSDAWLFAMASFSSSFMKYHERKRLFGMICSLPSLFEAVKTKHKIILEEATNTSQARRSPGMDNRRHPTQKPSSSNLKRKASTSHDDPRRSQKGEESRREGHISKRRASTSKQGGDDNVEAQQLEEELGDGDEGDEEMKYMCTMCEKFDSPDGFWIQCDNCDTWYHGACVAVSKETSDHIESFNCAICQNKLA